MPSNELKQRRKTTQGKPHEQTTETKPKAEPGKGADEPDRSSQTSPASPPSAVDIRTITCLLSLAVCLVLTWVVLLQAARFADIEEKSRLLYEKAANIEGLSNEISEISRKLAVSEEDLLGALSSMSLVAKMDNDVSGLRSVIAAVQGGEQFVSQNMQSINRSFQNATDVWRRSLEGITQDIGNLKSDSKALHNQVTAKINEAEKAMRSISEKLEELEDSTKRNARALERTESEDVEGVEEQVRWNSREIERLEEQHQALGSRGRELSAKIAEYQPRARQCEEQLPVVEDAVRSILRVSSDLAGLEKRVEDLTVQVFNMEDNMLKVISEILEIKTALDALEVDNSILKLRNELGVIKEKFESAQHLLTKLKGQAKPPHIESLKQDIAQLTEWSSKLTAKKEALEENLSALSRAVAQIEQKTTSITKDVAVKVSAVKTDLRRMSGLESEVEALLSSAQQLGEKVKQAEKQMVQKIGDLLVSSIARTSELKSSSERNSDKVDLLKRKLAELKEEDARLSERLLNLESGRARLLKTVTFASDLKPKVFTMRKDFSLLEPRVSDLTLRIGRLASDILEKEQEIALLKDTFSNLTVVKSDLQRVKQQLTEVREVSDMFAQGNQPGE